MKLRYLSYYSTIIFFFTSISLVMASSDASASKPFTLITVLYNETHPQRMQEFITCLEHNLAHPAIHAVHIVYDQIKDDAKNELLTILKRKKLAISYVKGRPTFGYCFNLANSQYPNARIIVCNGDIYFNKTLHALDKVDFANKFFALTRWDVMEDGSLHIFKQFKADGSFDDKMSYLSQDAWIFETPLKKFINPEFHMGTWACDGYIAYQAYISGLDISNPALSVQACHLHQSKIRHWIPQSIPGAKALILPWSNLS